MSEFFIENEGVDETYLFYSRDLGKRATEGRAFTQWLWELTADYLDGSVAENAKTHFQQSFWEMYLCATLLEKNLQVTRRLNRRIQNSGPDLQVGKVDCWIEAIAVTAGVGPDAVPEFRPRPGAKSVARYVPDGPIRLRLTSALAEKKKKYDGYLAKNWVSAEEPRVVAINAALVPSFRPEGPLPHIVSAVFPYGPLAVPVDSQTHSFGEPFFTRSEK